MLEPEIRFGGLKGVGTVDLKLQVGQSVYTLTGTNGIGKTKTLEALFQVLLSTHKEFIRNSAKCEYAISWVFNDIMTANIRVINLLKNSIEYACSLVEQEELKGFKNPKEHNVPVIFLASQNRGFVQHNNSQSTQTIGSLHQRRINYFKNLVDGMENNFTSLNMDTSIEEWFITLAQSSNPYQKQEDNREVEITTVLKLLHEIDSRIDPEFMEINGDGRINLKIEGEKRELSHLSTGFASILKMIQAIVSGYSYFTNETHLQNVKGIVLIDEIESHLHLSWQAHIILLLKRLLPNTTFYITTHSSIVLSQLDEGEAYQLKRDEKGVVSSHLIKSPNKAALVDVLKDAFGIDINKLKLERMSPEHQKSAKQQLLSLISQEDG